MTDEIQLISDGDGLAVIGDPAAVEVYMRAKGLWSGSRALDLGRLSGVLGLAADVGHTAAEYVANSGRWIKLTKESAQKVADEGLMDTSTPDIKHLMIGVPGVVKSWLQAETGPRSLATNPAALSGLGGLMAQAAKRQAIAEITDYLASINEKVDDLLAKVDNTVLKDLGAARTLIRRAIDMREEERVVSDDSWDQTQSVPEKIAGVQSYAIAELRRCSDRLVSQKSVKATGRAAQDMSLQMMRWLAVIAECFSLQDAFDDLLLDRALHEPLAVLDRRRCGIRAARQNRLRDVVAQTHDVLHQLNQAVERANARIVWTRKSSIGVVDSGNRLGNQVDDFVRALGSEPVGLRWDTRELEGIRSATSNTIQFAKDQAPVAAAVGGAAAAGLSLKKKLS